VQLSAASQTPADERQTVADDEKPSVGHVLPAPLHDSATSQTPAADRHTVPELTFASAGHVADEPGQVSAASHAPADERQTVAADSNWQIGEQQSPAVVLLSSHCSPALIVPLPQSELVSAIICDAYAAFPDPAVRVPDAPMAACASSAPSLAAPLPPAVLLTSHLSVMLPGCVKLPLPSALPNTASSIVFATVVVMLGATGEVVAAPVLPRETLIGVVPWTPL
jgi:hypothetical protein